ncbi:MAG TPA: hypothetical protein VMD28_09040 [Acidimicrobiales bacterium]|nr:hypothetical protein [Acidimicrobiales bacterium]
MTDAELAGLAEEIDALAERLADRALELLRQAVGEGASDAASTEKVVTRARRSLEKASALLRSVRGD